jgi:deglycase
MANLTGKKVAIIVHNYFEQAELEEPKKALEAAGAAVDIIAPESGEMTGVNGDINKGGTFQVDKTFNEAILDEYDGLVVPGGTINADNLRVDPAAQTWLQTFLGSGKPVAVICHGPWLIISSGLAKGKRLTSYNTLKDDLVNAGAQWVDEEVVVDGNLITSRSPDDLPAFNDALIEALAK